MLMGLPSSIQTSTQHEGGPVADRQLVPPLRSPRKSKISVEANLTDRLPKLKVPFSEGGLLVRLCRN